MDKILLNPIFLVAFGAFLALGVLVLLITLFIFKFLRKKIAQDIWGIPVCPWPCQEHKSIVDRVALLDGEIDVIEGRQKFLREQTLPDLPEKFVPRRDLEACRKEHEGCQRDRKANESELFNRVGALERK